MVPLVSNYLPDTDISNPDDIILSKQNTSNCGLFIITWIYSTMYQPSSFESSSHGQIKCHNNKKSRPRVSVQQKIEEEIYRHEVEEHSPLNIYGWGFWV